MSIDAEEWELAVELLLDIHKETSGSRNASTRDALRKAVAERKQDEYQESVVPNLLDVLRIRHAAPEGDAPEETKMDDSTEVPAREPSEWEQLVAEEKALVDKVACAFVREGRSPINIAKGDAQEAILYARVGLPYPASHSLIRKVDIAKRVMVGEKAPDPTAPLREAMKKAVELSFEEVPGVDSRDRSVNKTSQIIRIRRILQDALGEEGEG